MSPLDRARRRAVGREQLNRITRQNQRSQRRARRLGDWE